MRDTHEGMPELLAAFEREGGYFATVRVALHGDIRDIEFGVPAAEYSAVRRILQSRPFDLMPGLRYRYFIVGSIGRTGEHAATMDIRVEQGRDARQLSFEMPLTLARNLYWFTQLRALSEASHLQVMPVPAQPV